MTIRRATAEDMPTITARLGELPRVPRDDCWPGVAGQELPFWMTDPNNFVYVDTETRQVCRIAAMPEIQELAVVYLLPRADWDEDNMHRLRALLFRTLKAALQDRPDARDWTVWAEFADAPFGGRNLCYAWRRYFPGAMVAYMKERRHYRIWWSLAAAAGAAG